MTIDPIAYPAMLILALFALLLILGGCLLRLIQWEMALQDNRDRWLQQLRIQTRSLRLLRRQLEKSGGNLPSVPLTPGLRRKWRMFRWVTGALTLAKTVRS